VARSKQLVVINSSSSLPPYNL